ncbi:LexA family transcriptional regulator [Synergistaceae bacterium OttesenSCG-928-D05]|nr:LexA family transcriptional regulator [Synergistaceae bacterium OttesenSCG-928-D05]
MTISTHIKCLRRTKNLSQQGLAASVGVSRTTVVAWEKGAYVPEGGKLKRIAAALETSVSYLLGETSDPGPAYSSAKTILRITQTQKNSHIEIPIRSISRRALHEHEEGLYAMTDKQDETIIVSKESLAHYDPARRPFAVRVEGESMKEAGVPEGSLAIINPAEDVKCGTAALIEYNAVWSIRWVIYLPDGGVELHAADPLTKSYVIDKSCAANESWFRIIGPVVEVIHKHKPRHMML